METSECSEYRSGAEDEEPEIERLLQAFLAMRKVGGHGDETFERHPDIRPEWIMKVVEAPYDELQTYRNGRLRTIIVGRVPQLRQWISVVFDGEPDIGRFLTAYQDSRMEKRYGRRPWQSD